MEISLPPEISCESMACACTEQWMIEPFRTKATHIAQGSYTETDDTREQGKSDAKTLLDTLSPPSGNAPIYGSE
ncbi:hypothetical protein ACVWWN_006764 [Mycobacterium sp. URHB0021]